MLALITGASTGIGKELAVEFAKDKIDVILVSRDAKKLKENALHLESKYKIKTYVFVKDLSTPSSANELYNEINAKDLQVNYLINNAGYGDYGVFTESDLKNQESMITLNVLSLTKLTHLFAQQMMARKSGYIMNVASTASFQPGPFMSVYFATKHYVLAFSEALAEELKAYNVKVSVLCPGPTASAFGKRSGFKFLVNARENQLASSEEVAKFAFKKMKKGKVVYIHGLFNRIQATLVKFVPRSLIRKIMSKKMQ